MLIVPVILTASAWSQTAHYSVPAATVADDFAAYRQALDPGLLDSNRTEMRVRERRTAGIR